jgi:hypothetical protein
MVASPESLLFLGEVGGAFDSCSALWDLVLPRQDTECSFSSQLNFFGLGDAVPPIQPDFLTTASRSVLYIHGKVVAWVVIVIHPHNAIINT